MNGSERSGKGFVPSEAWASGDIPLGDLEVKVPRLTVQEDRTEPVSDRGDEQEVLWWKRLKAQIIASEEDGEREFQAILDTRSNVLRFLPTEDGPIDVRELARAVVYELGSFTPRTLSDLMQERPEPVEGQAVWLTTDGHLVSGLFHQVKEEGSFQARNRVPMPPTLESALRDLLKAIDDNLTSSFKWQMQHSRSLLLEQEFDASAWKAHSRTVLDQLEPVTDRRRFAEFFRRTEEYETIVRRARLDMAAARRAGPGDDPSMVNSDEFQDQARRGVRHGSHQYQQTGLKLLRDYVDLLSDNELAELDHAPD